MNTIYNIFLFLALPIILLRLLIKSVKNPRYRQHILQRLGCQLPSKLDNTLLFHAVSVGEFLAVQPLLIKFLNESNDNLWLSCTTPTGRAQIEKLYARYPQRIRYSYLPYDLPFLTKKFIRHTQPRMLIIVETEIWPNLLNTAYHYGIKGLLLNARLSEKSFKGYDKYARNLLKDPLHPLYVSAQTTEDANRLIKLGASSNHVMVLPSLKFHIDKQNHQKEILPINHLDNHWLWIAASTHSPEEEIVIENHTQLLSKGEKCLLCLAPRHPERSPQIASKIMSQGFNPKFFSKNESFNSDKDILIIDTLGDLDDLFDQAEIVFIGGSLVNHGGQNPLKALQAGCSVCFGPFMRNFQSLSETLVKENFVEQTNSENLCETIMQLSKLRDSNQRERILTYCQSLDNETIQQHYKHIKELLAF